MSARRPLLVAAALLAACNTTSTRPSTRLNGPSAVAVYRGLSSRDPVNLRSYLAVANRSGDDLRLLDAVDGKAVLAPGLVMSLSLPTAPRPALLAAGSLSDGAADLLVVASPGLVACGVGVRVTASTVFSGCIQVVATWDAATAVSAGDPADPVNRPDPTVDLGALAGGDDAEVLSLAVLPVVEADPAAGGWKVSPGKARVVAGLSGGRLLVADYARSGASIVKVGAAVHALGFDAVALSASPDLVHLYAASPDPIPDPAGAAEGVAELDLSGAFDAALPPPRALPAGAPTTAVLAATVNPFEALATPGAATDQYGQAVVRVYAALEPTRCGRDQALACGLVSFDAATGAPLADPAGELPAHAPIPVPGDVLGLVAVSPPSVGSGDLNGQVEPAGTRGPLQQVIAATGSRWTSTLAVATSTTGAAYLVDLARGSLAYDASVLAGARVASAVSSAATLGGDAYLALWDESAALPAPVLTHDATALPLLVGLTPGYTPSDSWVLGYQSALPGLSSLPAQLQADAAGDGLAWLAVQRSTGAAADSGPYRGAVRLYDPRLAIHPRVTDASGAVLSPGDIAVVTPDSAAACPKGPFELEVTDLLAPTPDFPGGAVAVAPRAVQPTTTVGDQVVSADPHCLDGAGRSTATVTFRSGELLLVGSSFGYAGRPVAQAAAADPGYSLGADAAALALSCPMLDGTAWPPATCDQACRDACERLLLARKARRRAYVYEACLSSLTECLSRWGPDPISDRPGPVLAFKVGWWSPTGTASPVRGASLQFTTSSGESPSLREPGQGSTVTGASLPSGLATFDRAGTTLNGADGVRVFISYPANQVLDASPSVAGSSSTLYR